MRVLYGLKVVRLTTFSLFHNIRSKMARFKPYYGSTLDSIFPPITQNWVLCFPCDSCNVHYFLQAGFEKTIQQLEVYVPRCRDVSTTQ